MRPPTTPDPTQASHADLEEVQRRIRDRMRLLDQLDERVRFESLLVELSAAFVNLSAEKIDTQIESSLQRIVEFLDIDRSSLGEFRQDVRGLQVTHSYVVSGFPPFPPSIVGDQFPWYTEQLRRGELLRLKRLPDDLPREAVQEREYCIQSGFKSHLAIPLQIGGSVLGAIAFGSFRNYRTWPDELVQRLRLVGEIFANALARKRADLALREREGRFRLMADTAPVMVWMSGRDKLCTYFNKPWLDFTGRPLQHELGDGWSAGVHADDLRRCLDTYVRAFDARQEFRMEYRLRRFDGEYRWILDTGVPRFESDGTFEGYIGSCIDVTDPKRVEEEAQHLRDQLARVARVTTLGELAAAIAHEINQPLCAIVSNAQAAQRFLAGDATNVGEVRETLQDIVADSRRASEVVGRIRALLQKGEPQRTSLDLNEAIREVVALLQHQLTRKNIALSLNLASGLPSVLGDRIQLQQVVLNLMVNAIDAMDHAARSRELSVLSARTAGENILVSVQDSGRGIPAEHLERVFDSLFTTKPGGIGIGLAISRSIIQAHAGRIWADAKPGGGATFHFTLPLVREPAP